MLDIFDRSANIPMRDKVMLAIYNIGFVIGFGGMIGDINTTIADVAALAIVYVIILYTVCFFYKK